jgi:N-acetylmuramoyl-L-alanine amidase
MSAKELTDGDILERLSDDQALALTMIGEARGDVREGGSSVEERIAVGCVIRTRQKNGRRWSNTIKGVCLQPDQFSCWNKNDPNRAVLLGIARAMVSKDKLDPVVHETLYIARGIIAGVILDRVGGADHYYNPRAVTKPPRWAFNNPETRDKLKEPTAIVGSHRFLKA